MKQFLIAGAATLALGGASVALAQAAQPMPMMHGSMGGAHTRAEVQAHVQAMFAKLDSNRDGFIDKAEIEAGHGQMRGGMETRMAEHMGLPEADRAAAFDRIDANHDGSISRQEFEAAPREHRTMMIRHGGMEHMGGGKMFERADANKDGRISLAEMQAAALAHFDAMDLNHDGTITPEEHQQARELRMQRKSL